MKQCFTGFVILFKKRKMIEREEITGKLVKELEPVDYINAMWEGGAAAFDRVDEWSDIDLGIDVRDDKIEEAFVKVEEILSSVSAIRIKYRLPDPTWHGNPQAFYVLEDSSPFLMIDLSVIRESNESKFTEKEIHGGLKFYFDKNGTEGRAIYNRDETDKGIEKKRNHIAATFELFKILPLKEINRGNYIEAFAFYNAYVLRPLVDLLRMKYGPEEHYNFGTRYVHYELPEDVVKKLEGLYFCKDSEELRRNYEEGVKWAEEILKEM